MNRITIAVDLAKSVFEVAVSHAPGSVSERHRLSRDRFAAFLANHPPARVVMEACGTAHDWGRFAQSHGHEPILYPAQYVRPYRRGSKTDRSDTDALLQADWHGAMNPVPVKSVAQQSLTALHRFRSEWLKTRTARINGVRGALREHGIPLPVGADRFLERLSKALEQKGDRLSPSLRRVVDAATEEIGDLNKRIRLCEQELDALARQTPVAERLQTIHGIGVITATALVGAVGDMTRFRSSRRFASFLGLVPRESSSGNTRRLGPITKRGDPYLRTLLIHGGRSVLRAAKVRKALDPLHAWALTREEKCGHNKAAVAVANKLARIAWAVWTSGKPYDPAVAPSWPRPSTTPVPVLS